METTGGLMFNPEQTHAVVGAPRLSRRHLPRPRLLSRLDHDVPLTVVRAPAGSGKTALLAEWARSLRTPGVWVSLDHDVSERGPFWQTVVTAMDDAGFLPHDSPLATGPLPPDQALPRVLRRGFGRLPRKHVLILDRAEVLDDPRVHEDILTLVQHTETVSVVIAGRARSGLEDPRAALRVDQSIIRARDLLLTVEEVAALIDQWHGDSTPAAWDAEPRLPQVVREATAGHPTFVRSLLQAAQVTSTSDLDEIRALGSAVVRGELRRFLDSSDRPMARLLLRSCIPDSLSRGLVRVLNGDADDVERHLHELESMGLVDLSAPSGEVTVPLFIRAHLRAEAAARISAETTALHVRTAHWELAEGAPLAALRHAVAAQDYDLATTVITHHWMRFLWDGILLEAEQVLEGIPRGDLRRQPILAGLLGLAANMNPARRGRAVGYLALSVTGARSRRRGASRPERLLLDVLESSFLRIAGESSGILFRARSATRMLDEWSSEVGPRPAEPVLRTQLAISFFRAGHIPEALRVLEDALAAPVDAPALALHQAVSIKAGILAHLGAMTASRALLRQAEQLPWPEGLRDSYLGAFYHYAAAWDRLEEFDLDGARRHIEVLDPQPVNIELRPYLTMLRASVGALRGDGAIELVRLQERQVRDDADRRTLPPERVFLGQAEAVLTVSSGQTGAARQLVAGLPKSVATYTYAALIELAAGRADVALSFVAASPDEAKVPPRVQATQCLVLAVSSLRQQDRRTALNAAERLVAKMRHHGLRAHLAMVPRADLLALRDLLRAERPDLVDALGDLDDVPDVVRNRPDVEPLSERERVVLAEVSTGAATATVAKRLGVSVNTVKSQLRSSYRKLGAASREEALAIAVREGLLAGG